MQKDQLQKAITLQDQQEELQQFLNSSKEYQEQGKKLQAVAFCFVDDSKNEHTLILQEKPEAVEEIYQSTIAYVQGVNEELQKEFEAL